MYLRKHSICFGVLFLFLISGCAKKKSAGVSAGTLRDLTGLDGCGWVIELEKTDEKGFRSYEPRNLGAMRDLKLADGTKIAFTFVDSEGISACMVGRTVILTSLVPY